MPIYEYACEGCGHELETLQKMNDAPLVDCPICKEPRLRRLISAAGFQLKGTGWYATDFKGNGKKPEKKSETKSESSAEGPSSDGKGASPAPS